MSAIPGPRSSELMARKNAAVARGVGTTVPAYAVRASGGIVEDADGNRLIDLGSGIAVTTIGNSAPRVVEAVAAQPFLEAEDMDGGRLLPEGPRHTHHLRQSLGEGHAIDMTGDVAGNGQHPVRLSGGPATKLQRDDG